jgi:hypothetical protein
MAVEDVYTQNRRLWVRLREKGGKRPCHHNLDESKPRSSIATASSAGVIE